MWVPNESGNGGYDDGQPAEDTSQQKYIMGYDAGEGGGGNPVQINNPRYAPTQETLDKEKADADAQYQYYLANKDAIDAANRSTYKSRGFFGNMIHDVGHNPVALAALTGITAGAASPFLASLGAANAAGGAGSLLDFGSAAEAGTAASSAGAATGGSAGGVGSFLTGASTPGFATTGTLAGEAGFGGATYGAAAPATLTGMTGAALPAAATSGATSGLAKLAGTLGVSKAAQMLGMDPSNLMKLIGAVGAGGIAALASRNKGQSGSIQKVGMQTPIDPNKLKYIGNNQYIPNPVVKAAAGGGISGLGMQHMAPNHYAAGGKYLHGPGDGMSDNIKANIDGHQEARLADGEFVIPADVVSHIGNGSSNAGAKKLHKMMDRIRHARTGNPKQGKQINPDKFLPA